jgi:hypothetical protein
MDLVSLIPVLALLGLRLRYWAIVIIVIIIILAVAFYARRGARR